MSFVTGMVLLMTTLAAKPAGHPLCVQRLDRKFETLPVACIDLGGEILDAHGLPNGGVAALVKGAEKGALEIVRWKGEAGAPPERRRLEVEGRILASRARADGDLVVVTDRAVVRVAPDGTITARRTFVARPENLAAVAPDGAWLLSARRLTWFGLDGSERILTGPWPAPRWRPGSDAPPGEPAPASLYATTSNDAVLLEEIAEEHPVEKHRPDDLTTRVFVTRFDREGRILGEVTIGKVRTKLEWFWSEDSSSNPTGIPQHFGLVRKRWVGGVGRGAVAEQPDGGVVAAFEIDGERGTTLQAFDQRLRDKWSRRVETENLVVASPPWARGLLFYDKFGGVVGYNDRGRSEQSIGFPFPKPFGDHAPPGASIGQTAAGEWYIVLW